jgi:hypothetical protein
MMNEYGIERSEIRRAHLQTHLAALPEIFSTSPARAADDLLPDSGLMCDSLDTRTLWGVIVETRQHRALEQVILSVVKKCDAPVQLFHGRRNRDFIQSSGLAALIREGRLFLTQLETDELAQIDYNRLLLSHRFWQSCIGRQKLLIFQTDSLCCESSDFGIDGFMGFDYIGSRWQRMRPVGLTIDGGSGGFSLRDHSKTSACLKRFPADSWKGGEDGYFGFHMSVMGARVATMDEAEQFATQDVFRARSFGCHQIDRLDAADQGRFLEYCPEARSVFPQLESVTDNASHLQTASDLRIDRPMFTSHKYKLVFFEVPRTGSNSVTAKLKELDPESPTVITREERGGGVDYHSDTGDAAKFPDYCLVAAHRNPYARLWSFWKRRKHGGNPDIFRSISWTRYVDWVCDPASAPEIGGALMDIPITEMIDVDTVDVWLDFHRLEQSWSALCDHLSIPSRPLAQLNQSIDHGDMANAYSPEMATRVAERFSQDFDYFNYDTDSWKAGSRMESNQ